MTQDLTPKQRLVAAVTMLSETYRQPLTAGALEGYWIALRDLEAAELATATARAVRERRFMPTPAELLELAGAGGPAALTAAMAHAWEAVRSAMDQHDYTTSVDFGPLVNAVVRNLGGWQALCAKSLRDLVWVRKDFERVYEAFASKAHDSLNGEPLRGAMAGEPVRVAIAGKLPQFRLTDGGGNQIAGVVRGIADEQERRP